MYLQPGGCRGVEALSQGRGRQDRCVVSRLLLMQVEKGRARQGCGGRLQRSSHLEDGREVPGVELVQAQHRPVPQVGRQAVPQQHGRDGLLRLGALAEPEGVPPRPEQCPQSVDRRGHLLRAAAGLPQAPHLPQPALRPKPSLANHPAEGNNIGK